MKKTLIIVGVIIILLLGAFLWLLGGASADNAPKDVQVIDLPETGAKLDAGRN